MKRIAWAAVGAAGLLAFAGQASATLMQATFTGFVLSGTDSNGLFGGARDPFGAAIAPTDLTGDAFTAVYVFDTTKGVLTTTPTSTDLKGGIQFGVDPSPIRVTTLSITGTTVSFSNDHFNGEVRYDAGLGTIGFASGENSGIDDELNLFISDPTTPLLLNTVFTVAGSGPDGLLHYSGGIDSVLGTLGVRSLTVVALPEPNSWALMLMGFFGAGWALRRRLALSGSNSTALALKA
jgi:hypothetical protein